MFDFMQRVIVNNLTKYMLTNIKLTHDGKGNADYKSIIKKIKPNESKEIALYTLREHGFCNLILSYTYKDISDTFIIYDKLSGLDLRVITLNFIEENGKIIINIIVDNSLLK